MTFRVVSFNVRYGGVDEGELAWERRLPAVVDLVRALRPDVLALQEVWLDQLSGLRERLPDFGWAAERAAGGEHTPVGYREDRLVRDDHRVLALSETPDELGSVGWDAAYPRTATVLDLTDGATDRSLTVCNAHFDHEGPTARVESASLLRSRLPGGPTVLAGDLNCRPGSPAHRRLLGSDEADGNPFTDPATTLDTYGPAETYVGFDADTGARRIDYALTRGVVVADYGVGPSTSATGQVASDHRPVVADLGLSAESSS